MRCLLTGGDGFLGRHLAEYLVASRHRVSATTRIQDARLPKTLAGNYATGAIDRHTDWREAICGQEVVVHLANRAHGRTGYNGDGQDLREVNVEGTLNLARQCSAAGVGRFLYISSVQVHGERTTLRSFHYNDPLSPVSPYAVSKMEAEERLRELCAKSEMELVIVRPPLVYGRGVKGNLWRLVELVDREWPLPLGGIKNQRDLISVENLSSLIALCIHHPAAAGQQFLCSDGDPVSTPRLIRMIARTRRKKGRLFPVPIPFLKLLGAAAGKSAEVDRLTGNLTVEISHTMETLNWRPVLTLQQGMDNAFSS